MALIMLLNGFFCMRLLVVGFALLLFSVAVNAQSFPVNLAFKHVLPDQLESIGYVNTIVQDKQGFMWFGGANGMARYDGYNLVFYKHEDGVAGTVSHSYINHMMVAQDGSLWVGTQSGLNLYDPETDTFETFLHQSDSPYGRSVNDVRYIFEDSRNHIWLGTRGGLNRFYPEDGAFTRYFYDVYPEGKGDSVVWAIVEDKEGIMWIGNHTSGLSRFDPKNNRFRHYRHEPDNPASITNNDVRTLYLDSKGDLWIGTYGGGLNKLPRGSDEVVRYPYKSSNKSDIIWNVLEDKEGTFWIGNGGGISLFNPATEEFKHFAYAKGDPTSPGNHVANVLYEDRAGDVWVGYFPSGVDMVDRQASVFRNYVYSPNDSNSVADGGILATFEDVDNNLWIGAGYGLSYFDRGQQTFTNFRHDPNDPESMPGDTVLSIVGDDEGYLWLGIWAAGLTRYNPATGEFKQYMPEPGNEKSLLGKEAWGLEIDRDGILWVATEEGVNRYNRETDDFTRYLPHPTQMDGDSTLYTRVVYEDSQRNFWVGSIRGLYLLDRVTGEFERFRHREGVANSISAEFIKAIYEDSRGSLWIGTHGGGLNRMDTRLRTFESFHIKDGLPDEVITGIIEDEQGRLWLSTHKGLVRYDLTNNIFRSYDKRHGLSGNLFNRNTPLKTHRGELVFGSTKGLTIFNPADLWDNKYVPPVVITDFQIFNKPVPINTQDSPLSKSPQMVGFIPLTYEQSVFSFAFSALNYRSSEENQYAYKLEGFDKEWHQVGKKRNATYTNLDAGDYTFRVKGSNNEGLWNEEGVSVRIKISPPLWKTWWAYALYIGVGIGFIYFILHFQLKKQAYEREHTLNQRLQDLDKLKDEFLANTSHELRTPLNGIIGLSESLLDEAAGPVPEPMKRYLEMIAHSGKRLANLVNDILDFSKLKNHTLELNKKPIDLHQFVSIIIKMTEPLIGSKSLELINAVPEHLPAILADDDRLQQILYNLLGNAIKFTDSGSITVAAQNEDDYVVLDVIDTGIGIPETQVDKIFGSFEQVDGTNNRKYGGTGLGLAITKRLVELHGGSVEVSSKVGSGSRFRLRFPIDGPKQQE